MKKTFTILHTNEMHSAFIGMGPASDYTPFTLKRRQDPGRVSLRSTHPTGSFRT